MKKNSVIWFLILFLLCFVSCSKKDYSDFKFDNSQPLSLAPDVSWALITEPYASFHESLDWNSEILGYCKRGDILQVISRSQDESNTVWYKFESGWLPKSSLIVYSNRFKAENASQSLRE